MYVYKFTIHVTLCMRVYIRRYIQTYAWTLSNFTLSYSKRCEPPFILLIPKCAYQCANTPSEHRLLAVYVSMYISMHVCTYIYMCGCLYLCVPILVWVYVSVCIYIYIYVYIYTYPTWQFLTVLYHTRHVCISLLSGQIPLQTQLPVHTYTKTPTSDTRTTAQLPPILPVRPSFLQQT